MHTKFLSEISRQGTSWETLVYLTDNIKTNVEEINKRDPWRGLVSTGMNIRIPRKACNLLTS